MDDSWDPDGGYVCKKRSTCPVVVESKCINVIQELKDKDAVGVKSEPLLPSPFHILSASFRRRY